MNKSVIMKAIRTRLKVTQGDFAASLRLSRTNLSHMECGKNTPTIDILNQIVKIYNVDIGVVFEMLDASEDLLPELSAKLLKGEGEAVITPTKEKRIHVNEINTLNGRVGENDSEKKWSHKWSHKWSPIDEISEDNNLIRDGDIADSGKVSNENSPARINGRGVEVRSTFDDIQRNYYGATRVESGGIPLIPIDAAAGILSGDNTQVMDYECEHYVVPAFHRADFLIRVIGDSMIPRYMGGDLVAGMRLQVAEFMQWNKPYIIDSTQGVLLKRVKRSEKQDHLLLISENNEYDSFDIPMSEIQGLALVVGLIRIE